MFCLLRYSQSVLNTSLIVYLSPYAMLKAFPACSLLAKQHLRLASITFSIYVKSLEKLPSPLIVGLSSLSNCLINFGITAAYWPFGSCLLPKTLKYLNPYVSRPYNLVYNFAYSSLTFFVKAYGDNTFPSIPSTLGKF